MPKLRVHNFSVSLDEYAAGPGQTSNTPLGVGSMALHEWAFATRTYAQMFGIDGGTEGIDDEFASRGSVGIGDTIMGRNMFGPIRGSWVDDRRRGWWGEDPPYHHPVFVLMQSSPGARHHGGSTTFHFVTDGIEAALEQAMAAAGGHDVGLGGGVHAIQQYLGAGLIDELHRTIVHTLLGSGERLFDHRDTGAAGYHCARFAASDSVAHVVLARTEPSPAG